jgi:CPA2 family monovalent cation:H+ antiporter-2
VHPAQLLLESGLIVGVVALSGIFFRKLRLSTIPAYILLGLLLGPVVGRSELVEVFALWGVVLLLFFVGLEFSLPNLVASRKKLFRLGTIDLLINFPVGFVAGLLLGWGLLGALFVGAAFYVSSSAIVARSVIELQRTAHPETEPALNILVFEDLAIAVLLAILSGIAVREGDVVQGLGGAVRAVLFLGVIGLIAWLGRPLLDKALNTDDDELFVLLMASVLLLISFAAVRVGVSEAIGAFLTGSIMAETGHKRRIETLFAPLQGIFAAMFFLAFGLSVDTTVLKEFWLPAVLLAIAAVPTKLFTGWMAGRAEGLSTRASLALGFTLVPRGEFSIVIAGVAASAGYRGALALITLFVLILAVLGTVAIQHAPTLTRWLGVRSKAPPVKPHDFDLGLARHDDAPG